MLKLRPLALGIAMLACMGAGAQHFQEPSKANLGSPYDFVDPYLADENSTHVLKFTENHALTGIEAKILYFNPIKEAVRQQLYGDYGPVITRKQTIRGKKENYSVYSSPYVYYGILDFPEGRFYGLFTTGFNDLRQVLNNDVSKLHPLGDVRILAGTLVTPDGNQVEIAGTTPDKLSKPVAKPSGTYRACNMFAFNDIDLTFNAGGTGKAVFKKKYQRQAPPKIASERTYREKGTKRLKTGRRISGGYDFFIVTNIPVNFKWHKDEIGNLHITFTGKPAINITAEVNPDTEFSNQTITESDKAFTRREHRQDLLINEDVALEKKLETKRQVERFEEWKEIVLPVLYLGNDRIITKYWLEDKRPGYPIFQTKKFDNTDTWYASEMLNLPDLIKEYSLKREYGILKIFPDIKKHLTRQIESSSPAPLKTATEYYVHDIAPNGISGKINFISGGKTYDAEFSLDNSGHLSSESILSSLKENTTIPDMNAQIEKDNAEILGYKKDKKRSKIVKEYEKRIKKLYPFSSEYTTTDGYKAIIGRQVELQKIQRLFLEELR